MYLPVFSDPVQVLEFLRAFPPDDHVVSLVYSDSSPIKHVFPFATPFKALYSVYAFEQCLNSALLNVSYSISSKR